jgi:hypothetical protein
MADKRQTRPAELGWAIPNAFKGFDGGALLALQHRNLEAMTRATSLMADATAMIASKQLEMFQKALDIRPEVPQMGSGSEGFSGFLRQQIQTGRETFETSVKQARELNDAVRECYYSIADEFEACARDNLGLIEEEAKTATAAGPKSASEVQPQRPQAVSA